ncbi:TetR/AcrR family transcriptional regulator [Kineococcus sp. SYSU DK003]|uniref:TetR/AcrR family transcriptional regulator n=1 Tax=Kineococcus sp. SYSU DK003 TaxID=3383124 RepID=UPI003D7D36A8
MRGPYRNGIERRRQLVDAAWGVIARRGYTRASLREIAQEVGVSPAGILRLFGSKEALLIAVLERWWTETQLLGDRVEIGAGAEYFGSFGDLMRYHVQHPGLIELFLTMCTEATDRDHPASTWVKERYERIVADAVENLAVLQRDAGVPVLGRAHREREVRWLFAAMDGLELQWIADPAMDLVGHSDALFEMTLRRWLGTPGAAPDRVPPASVAASPAAPQAQAEGAAVPGATVRGPYRTGVERRRQIVLAATELFGRHGYAGASVREIADRVGLSAAALLRYFGTKEQLLFAVLDDWDASTGEWVDSPRGAAYVDTLERAMAHHDENPGLVELWLTMCAEASDPEHPARDWVARRFRRIVGELDGALRQAAADGAVAAMDADRREFEARVVFAVMDGLELQWIADPKLDLGATFRPFLRLCRERWAGPAVTPSSPAAAAGRGPRGRGPRRNSAPTP